MPTCQGRSRVREQRTIGLKVDVLMNTQVAGNECAESAKTWIGKCMEEPKMERGNLMERL